jgi:hypothetical protein
MRRDPEQLERLITHALRNAPPKAAPASLERRVLGALSQRSSQSWWRKDFGQWPVLARLAFVGAGAGLLYLTLGAPLWLWESSRGALPAEISWLQSLMQLFRVVVDHLPSVFVFGALAALVMLYATLFGVGAVAYRTLFANRETQR